MSWTSPVSEQEQAPQKAILQDRRIAGLAPKAEGCCPHRRLGAAIHFGLVTLLIGCHWGESLHSVVVEKRGLTLRLLQLSD
jgi:hypothetical protein